MRYKLIRRKAMQLDKFIDNYRRKKGRNTFPRTELSNVIRFVFPNSSVSGQGRYKIVHKISATSRELALKTGNKDGINNDIRIYERIPRGRRNRYFAKIYWKTKYCLLQKHGEKAPVPAGDLARLKGIGKDYGLKDIRPANIRRVGGRFKIIDASLRKK